MLLSPFCISWLLVSSQISFNTTTYISTQRGWKRSVFCRSLHLNWCQFHSKFPDFMNFKKLLQHISDCIWIPYYSPCTVEEEKKIDLTEYFGLDINSEQSTARSSSIYRRQSTLASILIMNFFCDIFAILVFIKPVLTDFFTFIDVLLCEYCISTILWCHNEYYDIIYTIHLYHSVKILWES